MKFDALTALLGAAWAAVNLGFRDAVISKRRAALADVGIDEAMIAPSHARLINIMQARIEPASSTNAMYCNKVMRAP